MSCPPTTFAEWLLIVMMGPPLVGPSWALLALAWTVLREHIRG